MELHHIGVQCNLPTCKQLDYLPFTCNHCNEKFCKNHFKPSLHNCEKFIENDIKVNTCPNCNKPIPFERGEDPKITLNNHISRNCQDIKLAKIKKQCNLKSCKQRTIVAQHCDKCNFNYCMKHRFPEAHDCIKLGLSENCGGVSSDWINGIGRGLTNSSSPVSWFTKVK